MNQNITKILKEIAANLRREDIFEQYSENIRKTESSCHRITILGHENSGKTALLNLLSGTSFPMEALPSATDHAVEPKDGNEWAGRHGYLLSEIHATSAEFDQVKFLHFMATTDVCIYVMNAQSALNRTDVEVLRTLNDAALNTIVVLGRCDLVNKADRSEVDNYVRNNLNGMDFIRVAKVNQGFINPAVVRAELEPQLDSLLEQANVEQTRSNFQRFFMVEAVSHLFEECQQHIKESNEHLLQIDEKARKKEEELSEKSTDWLRLQTELHKHISSLSELVRDQLEERRADMLRRLSHDVDVCGDVKLFWEKDFPFRLEELMRAEAQFMGQKLDAALSSDLQWLRDELLRRFGCRMALTATHGWGNGQVTANTNGIEITDMQRIRTVTRVGTAVTVIAAGTLLATSGIAGIVMAVGMVSGLGAEAFMRKKVNQTREEIKKHLPSLVTKVQMQYADEVEQRLIKLTDELVGQLHSLQKEWRESSLKDIRQEAAIARYNFAPTKWETVMARINQLSELIMQ